MKSLARLSVAALCWLAAAPAHAQDLVDDTFRAIDRGDVAFVKKMIQQGLDVNSLGGNARSFLHHACAKGNVPLVT